MKENKILISILVPTYNRVKYLEECLDSIVIQEGFKKDEVEILIGDNSEGYDTKEFMDRYLTIQHRYMLKYIKNEGNKGSTWNINNLLSLSKGIYYIILSDDDKFYGKNSLKILYDNLKKYNLDACYGKNRIIDGAGNDNGDFGLHAKIGGNKVYYDSFDEQIGGHSIGFGGVLYKNFGYKYDYGSKWFGDWNMNLQYLYNGKKVALINEYTFYYREHNTNDSKTVPKLFRLQSLFYNYNFFKISWYKRLKYLSKVIMKSLKYRLGCIINLFKKIF